MASRAGRVIRKVASQVKETAISVVPALGSSEPTTGSSTTGGNGSIGGGNEL